LNYNTLDVVEVYVETISSTRDDFVVSAIMQGVDMITNDAIVAADAIAFGTTAAIVSHFSFSSDLKYTVAIRLNVFAHIFIPNLKLFTLILVAYSLLL
jgi:hypothetical protein